MQDTNNIPHISPGEALERMQKGEIVLIDVREPDELEVISIQGAVNIPLSAFDAGAVINVAEDREIVFFCKMGGRAINVWQYFTQTTGRKAVCMTGSITAWAAKGLPVVTGS